jgi:hypothetical protein
MDERVSLDLTGWYGVFQRELDALLSDMAQLYSAAEEKRYSDCTVKSGSMVFTIPNAEALGESAPERASRQAFLGAMSKFSGFLDRLIATRRVATNGVPVKRDLRGEAELLAYVSGFMEDAVAEVARDARMSLPKKLDCFPGVDPAIRQMALDYNMLRNALEHHHDLPRCEVKVTVWRVIPFVQDQQITEFPVWVPAGGTLGIRMVDADTVFPANQKVVLEPQLAHDLIFTLQHRIAAAILQWHVGTGNPKSLHPTQP